MPKYFFTISYLLLCLLPSHTLGIGSSIEERLQSCLPEDARIQTFGAAGDRAIFYRDLDNNGVQEAVVFYTVAESKGEVHAHVSILEPRPDGCIKKSTFDFPEAVGFLFVFNRDSGLLKVNPVSDVNGDGIIDIIAVYTFGGTAGGGLKILNWNGRVLGELQADWEGKDLLDDIDFKDLDNDFVPEIIFKHTTASHLAAYGLPNIYKWNGKAYKLANELFPRFYDKHIEEQKAKIYSTEPLPPSWRALWCSLAVQGYIYQKDYEGAISLCQRTMGLIADLPPNSDKIEAVSDIHVLLGDVYTVMGEIAKAAAEYEAALKLHPENKKALDKLAALQTRRK